MNIPSVTFMYLTPAYLRYACNQYAGMPINMLQKHMNDLATVSLDKYNTEDAAFGQILYSDIELLKNKDHELYEKTLNEYRSLMEEYSEKLVKTIVTEDEESIKKSILKIIEFVMDKVFKINTLRVSFVVMYKDDPFQSNYPSLIYEVLQQYFNIKEQVEHHGGREITITKRFT